MHGIQTQAIGSAFAFNSSFGCFQARVQAEQAEQAEQAASEAGFHNRLDWGQEIPRKISKNPKLISGKLLLLYKNMFSRVWCSSVSANQTIIAMNSSPVPRQIKVQVDTTGERDNRDSRWCRVLVVAQKYFLVFFLLLCT